MIINDISLSNDEPTNFVPSKPSFITHVEKARAFATTYQPQLTDGSTAEMVVDNTTSDKIVLVKTAIVRGAGYADVDVYTGRNIDTAGGAENTLELNVGSGATPSITVDAGGTYSGGTLKANPMLPGGSGTLGSAPQHGSWESPPTLLQPGESSSLAVTNQTGGTEEYELAVVFIEVPV